MIKTVLPGKTIGIIGGGQLGRMLAMSAKEMGYKIAVLDPSDSCCAKIFSDIFIQAASIFSNSKVMTSLTEHNFSTLAKSLNSA